VVATPGQELWRRPIGAGALDLLSDVAVDGAGNVAYSKPRLLDEATDHVAKLTGDGAPLYTRPFGTVVTMDAAGNAYVAGPFSGELDLGAGTMQAEGPLDAFVAMLDAQGTVVFAHPLHLCGAGIASIAVAPDGRIALSGAELGTIVLAADHHHPGPHADHAPDIVLRKHFAGDVAFDSHGNLVIAGAFAGSLYLGAGVTLETPGDEDGFVVAYSGCDGCYLWSAQITDPPLPVTLPGSGGFELAERTRQAVTAVAIDAADNVVIAGELDYAANVLGDVMLSPVSIPEIGLLESAFVAKLDMAGAKAWAKQLNPVEELADVATGPTGNIVVSGAQHTQVAPSTRTPMLIELAPAGDVLFSQGTTIEGAGHGVAVDACGDVFQSISTREPLGVFEAALRKVAL